MLKTRKMTGSWLFGGFVGVTVYFVIILLLLLAGSSLVVNGSIAIKTAGVSVLPVMMVASYFACLLAESLSDNNKLLGCIAVLAVSLAVRLMLTLFTYEEQTGSTILYCVPELIGFALALLTVAKRGGKSRTKKFKKRYL